MKSVAQDQKDVITFTGEDISNFEHFVKDISTETFQLWRLQILLKTFEHVFVNRKVFRCSPCNWYGTFRTRPLIALAWFS